MKTRLTLLLCLALAAVARADESAAPAVAADSTLLTAEQLDQLVGPIALYPDALIALILPASTAPADIVLAARYLNDDGNPADVATRSWDESVKSLVHYAEVVKWMDNNLSWTKQLGEAFAEQPAQVMQAIQRLRAKARAAGTLIDSPQQQVLYANDVISIVPTQPDTIYVPYYDPLVVYAPRPEFYGTTTFISYSAPFAAGAWLSFDCDWHNRTVWTTERHWNSRERHDWRRPVFPGQYGYVNDPNRHPWKPANTPRMPIVASYRRTDHIQRPAPVNAPSPQQWSFANPGTPNLADRRNDPTNKYNPNRPQRNYGPSQNREQNFVGPIQNPSTVTTTTVSPAPATPSTNPPPARRYDPGRNRDANDFTNRPPNRSLTFPNQASAPAPNPAPASPPPPSNYPFGPAPSSRIVPAFNGPIVAPMPAPSAPPSHQQMRFPSPPPAPAATPPPAQSGPQSSNDDRRRGPGDNDRDRSDRRNQP